MTTIDLTDGAQGADGPRCRVCGCTDDAPCPGGCSWIQSLFGEGDLCSSCDRVMRALEQQRQAAR